MKNSHTNDAPLVVVALMVTTLLAALAGPLLEAKVKASPAEWLGFAGNVLGGFATLVAAIIAWRAVRLQVNKAGEIAQAEQEDRNRDRAARAHALGIFLVPELTVLKGELERFIRRGKITSPAVVVPESLKAHTSDLYLLGDTGNRLLQSIGLINGVNAQHAAFLLTTQKPGLPREHLKVAESERRVFGNSEKLLSYAIYNVDFAIKALADKE